VGRESEIEALWVAAAAVPLRGLQIIGFGGEGKTSLIQAFVQWKRSQLSTLGYTAIVGFSFYRGDVGIFVNDCFAILSPNVDAITVAERASAVARVLTEKKVLLILDGLEVCQNDTGEIQVPYIQRIVDSVRAGPGLLIVTSRISIPNGPPLLLLEPLSREETVALLAKSARCEADKDLLFWVERKAGRHALSLRIVIGFLREQKEDAIEALKSLSLDAIKDEGDPTKLNKSHRLLEQYVLRLPREQICFLECFTMFRGSAPLATMLECFAMDLGQASINASLAGTDVRSLIVDLVRRRFIIVEDVANLTAHPCVYEFFRSRLDERNARALRRAVAFTLWRDSPKRPPNTLAESQVYMEICYQSAGAEDWSTFQRAFFEILNRGELDYLVDYLGAWQEYLDLALLAFPDRNCENAPMIWEAREFYRAGVARANKHLGAGYDSLHQYWRCLVDCAESRHPNTAMYANNCFTLSILMARFDLAAILMRINLGTLHWIAEDWKMYWQKEHGFFLSRDSLPCREILRWPRDTANMHFMCGIPIRVPGDGSLILIVSITRTLYWHLGWTALRRQSQSAERS
jgi:hypothetical protein